MQFSEIDFIVKKGFVNFITVLGKVPIGILPGKRHITWVLALLLFSAEFQMELLAPYAISYDTRPVTY